MRQVKEGKEREMIEWGKAGRDWVGRDEIQIYGPEECSNFVTFELFFSFFKR